MEKTGTTLIATITCLLISSCASIISMSKYPISITTNPTEAEISITNSRGTVIYQGNTPAALRLKAGEGYFRKASYSVKITKEGYMEKIIPIYFKLDNWYFGNFIIGGFLGFLIIDPLTGAMYKLDTEFIHENLLTENSSMEEDFLRIIDINEIPVDWKEHFVKLE